MTEDYRYIGHGVYGFAEAQRLTGVPSSTIRRWTQGYTFRHGEVEYYSPPVMGVKDEDGHTALRFVDLMHVMALNGFRKAGVSWKTLRYAVYKATERTECSHPFARQTFFTDGRAILMPIVDGVLLNIVSDRLEFEKVVAPFFKSVDYERIDEPVRWWPMGHQCQVVLDPQRSFGAPICAKGGVLTSVVNAHYQTEQSIDAVAWWYNISPQEVTDAVEFERRLAA